MDAQELAQFLKGREFISVATCDFAGRPNAAPKFLLKVEKDHVYLVDYTIGRTWENLRKNPRASLSFSDTKTLIGYQLNGSVEVIDAGEEYAKLCAEVVDRQVAFTTKHIIEDVRGEQPQESFEVTSPDRYVIFKVKLEEIVEMGPRGDVLRQKVGGKKDA